MAAKTPRPVA
ncbi:hypothetical protein YPPY88_3303, partial [Yersinia pestis PY-88]